MSKVEETEMPAMAVELVREYAKRITAETGLSCGGLRTLRE